MAAKTRTLAQASKKEAALPENFLAVKGSCEYHSRASSTSYMDTSSAHVAAILILLPASRQALLVPVHRSRRSVPEADALPCPQEASTWAPCLHGNVAACKAEGPLSIRFALDFQKGLKTAQNRTPALGLLEGSYLTSALKSTSSSDIPSTCAKARGPPSSLVPRAKEI